MAKTIPAELLQTTSITLYVPAYIRMRLKAEAQRRGIHGRTSMGRIVAERCADLPESTEEHSPRGSAPHKMRKRKRASPRVIPALIEKAS